MLVNETADHIHLQTMLFPEASKNISWHDDNIAIWTSLWQLQISLRSKHWLYI